MSTPPHQKHADLAKPGYGFFARNEWAIIGTPCGIIKKLAFALTERLCGTFKTGYVDADHRGADEEAEKGRDPKSAMAHGARLEYTDKIAFHRFDRESRMDTYHYRQWFSEMDAVLVNGNHFQAKQQIVVIDPKKEESLKKKLDRLTDVQLILLKEGSETIYPFLTNHLKKQPTQPRVMNLRDVDEIAAFLEARLRAAIPPIYGLVLAGGKSRRMGQDKGLIDYHGKTQREYTAELISRFCEKTFLSVRPDQVETANGSHPLLPDTFLGMGPFGAILSAFQQYPNHAWLVVAVDLPLLDEATLAELTARRNPSRIATAFNSPFDQFPEPLIAIWEPKSYPVLFRFLAQGYSCPRKTLINSDVELLDASNPEALTNVNKPEESEEVFRKVGRKGGAG